MNNVKGFTLFELLISIVLVGILYSFTVYNFDLSNNIKVDISNLKKKLLTLKYENNVTIKCVEKDYSCFILLDGVIQKEKLDSLFQTKPIVYAYNDLFEKLTFEPLELETLEWHNVVFEYTCNSNRKCTESIISMNDKLYILNDLKIKPTIIKNKEDVVDYFQDKIYEVRDAF